MNFNSSCWAWFKQFIGALRVLNTNHRRIPYFFTEPSRSTYGCVFNLCDLFCVYSFSDLNCVLAGICHPTSFWLWTCYSFCLFPFLSEGSYECHWLDGNHFGRYWYHRYVCSSWFSSLIAARSVDIMGMLVFQNADMVVVVLKSEQTVAYFLT